MIQGSSLLLVGWREWVSLPELGIPRIKAKIDTGARTSALHAFKVESYQHQGQSKVVFTIHPLQSPRQEILTCTADLVDIRSVVDSGGHKEERPVISTQLVLARQSWLIEITLTNRDDMKFRMLLGRTAMQNRCLVNPTLSYVQGKLADYEYSHSISKQ